MHKTLDTNSGLQSIEDLTDMGFCSPNYSPIPPVGNINYQQPRVSLLTSMPIMDGGLGLKKSDLTHNRGKATIVNSPTEPQEPTKKSSKGGKVKSSQGAQQGNIIQLSTSSHNPLNWLIKRTSASTVAAKVTLQESAPADLMITERNQGQHQGTSRTTEQTTQVV